MCEEFGDLDSSSDTEDICDEWDTEAESDYYEATPNEDISILLEDGTIDSAEHLQELLDEEKEYDVEPYEAISNSDVNIILEDGTTDTAEHIQEALEECEEDEWEEVEGFRDLEEETETEYYNAEIENTIRELDLPKDMEDYIRNELENGNDEILELLGMDESEDELDEEQKVKSRPYYIR